MPGTSSSAKSTQTAAAAPVEQPMFGSGDVQQVAMMPAHEYKARMQAKVFEEADKIKSQETIPGGAFVVEGQWVDGNGKPLSDDKLSKLKAGSGTTEAKAATKEEIERWEKTTPSLLNEAPEQLAEQQKGQEAAATEEAKR